MRLLVVDDDPSFRSLIAQSAPKWLRVVTCASTKEAVEALSCGSDHSVDLALIDLQMQPYLGQAMESEGLALVRWMREHGFFMPVALVSAFVATGDRGRVAAPVLRKPVDLPRVYAFMDAYRKLYDP